MTTSVLALLLAACFVASLPSVFGLGEAWWKVDLYWRVSHPSLGRCHYLRNEKTQFGRCWAPLTPTPERTRHAP